MFLERPAQALRGRFLTTGLGPAVWSILLEAW
jgi:hypothetical protein